MMTMAQWQSFLLWAAALNYATLLLAIGVWRLAGGAASRLHARWFGIDPAQCRGAVYLMLGLYKLAIWLLLVVPWLVLCLMGPGMA